MKIKSTKKTRRLESTYDIEVEETHNYFLKCGKTNLVSHNSSVIQSSTNGIEPIRDYLIFKGSKANTVPVICPHYSAWKSRYTLASEIEDNTCLINIHAALQKWVDMSISGNLYYNNAFYPDKKLPDAVVIKDMIYSYQMGIKNRYYINTFDGDKQMQEFESVKTDSCDGGACIL